MSRTQPFKPDDAEAKIKDLERRIKALETAPRLTSSAVNVPGGTFPLFQISEEGFALPATPIPLVQDTAFGGIPGVQLVTAGGFSTVWEGSADCAIANAYVVTIPWTTDAATTGELKVHNNVLLGGNTATISLAAGSGGFQTFVWLHGQPVGTGPFNPQIQARRSGGAGNVNIFAPLPSHQIGGSWVNATATGV